METFWFVRFRFRRAYDSAYDSDFRFSLGRKFSYDSLCDSDYDSVASKNQPLGSLRNHDDDGDKDVKNLHISSSKIIVLHALHAQFSFLTFRRRSHSFCDVKWPVLQLCGRRDHMMTKVKFCLLIYEALVPIKFLDSQNTFYKRNDFD